MSKQLKIKPAFVPPDIPTFETHLSSIEHLVNTFLPKDLFPKEGESEDVFFTNLDAQLPIIQWSKNTKPPTVISLALLCSSHIRFSNGTGRFFSDMVDRFALPGHYLGLEYIRSFDFHFIDNDSKQYFICEIGLRVNTELELKLIEKNLPKLSQEIRLIARAVYEARQIMALKPLTMKEKSVLIQEKITSLIERPSREFDLNIFDQMQHLMHKLSAQEKNSQIKELIAPFVEKRPQTFDRDIFNEIQYFVLLFRDQFTAVRDLKHISRIICYQYLFRKSLQAVLKIEPDKRHLYVKFLKGKVHEGGSSFAVLGVVIAIHINNNHELIAARHITESVQSLIPDALEVAGSYIVDNRTEKIRMIYIEFQKEKKNFFSKTELHALRQNLATELGERIENVIHPIFMPRNDEEILRHIVILNNELKYVKDIPQVVVNFEKQTPNDLSFTVILLRLLKPGTLPLKKIFSPLSSPFKISFEEEKVVGCLKNKFSKEANVLKFTLPKGPFFRKNYSLDLRKARQAVISTLTDALGDIRDYNGGMIAGKTKIFDQFSEMLSKNKKATVFLMENFFYSIEPPLMQSILDPELLKNAFLHLLEAMEHNFKNEGPFLRSHTTKHALALTAASAAPFYKEALFQELESLEISDISFSFVTVREIYCLTLFFHCSEDRRRDQLCEAIEKNFLAAVNTQAT